MTRSQANRIEEIIRTQDVRDPRLTLDAIAAILAEKPSIKPEQSEAEAKLKTGMITSREFEKVMAAMMEAVEEPGDEIPHLVPDDVENEFGNPVATIRIYNTKPRPGKLNVAVVLDCCDNHIEARHFVAVKEMIVEFASKKAAEQLKQEFGQ